MLEAIIIRKHRFNQCNKHAKLLSDDYVRGKFYVLQS